MSMRSLSGVMALGVIVFSLAVGAARGTDLDRVIGQPYVDTMLSSVLVQREFRKGIPSVSDFSQTAHDSSYLNRIAGISSGNAVAMAPIPESAYQPYVSAVYEQRTHPWVMWDAPWLLWDRQKETDDYRESNVNSSGFGTGFSRLIGQTGVVGLAVGYDSRTQYSSLKRDIAIALQPNDTDSYFKNRADTLHTALYAGGAIGCFFVDAYAGFSRSWNRNSFTYTATPVVAGPPGISGTANAKYTEDVYSAGASASYVIVLPGNTRITPSVGIDYSHVRRKAFSINDSTFGSPALAVDKANYDSFQVPVMLALNSTYSCSFLSCGGAPSMWTPEVRGGWVGQFGSRQAKSNFSVPATGYTTEIKSYKLPSSYGVVGVGMKIKLCDKYIFGIDYDYSFGKDKKQHSVVAEYGMTFGK